MATINELVTRLSFKLDNRGAAAFDRRMQQMAGAANRAVNRMQSGFSRMYARLDRLSGGFVSSMVKSMGAGFSKIYTLGMSAFSRLSTGFNNLRNTVGRGLNAAFKLSGVRAAESQVSGLQRQIAGIAAATLGAVGAGQTGKFVFGAASEYETAITRLTTLVGTQKAPQIFKDLQKFAATTPNELPEVIEMFNRLEGAGFELLDKKGNVKYDVLTQLGDLAAASGQKLGMLTETMLSAGRGMGSMVDNFTGLSAKAEDGVLAVEMFDRVTGKTVKKLIDPKNKAALREFFQAGGRRQGIAGGMEALSKTLEGQQAQIQDALKSTAVAFYQGFGPHVHKLLLNVINSMGDFEGKIKGVGRNVGVFVSKDLPGILRTIKDIAPLAAWGIGLMVANMTGGKIIAAANIIKGMSLSMIAIEGAAVVANLAVGGLFLVAGAVMLDFVNYLTTGESKLGEFAAKWPWVKQGLESAYESWKIFYFALEIGFKKIWIQLKGWMGEVKYFAQYLWDSVLEPFKMYGENLRTTFDAVKELFGWISDRVKPLTDSLGRMAELAGLIFNRGQGDDGMGNVGNGLPSPVAGGVGVNQSMANSLVKAAQVTKTAAGYCLNAVWRAQNLGLKGVNLGDSKITSKHAADSAAQLANDPRFKEIKVTAQMMDDPKYARLLHGATAIFSRTSGYSPISGHAEIWDMQQRAALYGRGPKSLELSKSRLAGARVFVPRSNLDQMPASTGAGMAPAPGASVVITQNFNGAANPSTVKRAAQEGTGTALNKAALTKPLQAAR